MHRPLLILAMLCSCSGCVATRLPLCPAIAEVSYDTRQEGKGQLIGRYLRSETERRLISVRPLTPFIAEFRGTFWEIAWLRRNYVMLLCAFNPDLVIDDEGLYRRASSSARKWIQLVDAGEEAELMEFGYCRSCCTTPP